MIMWCIDLQTFPTVNVSAYRSVADTFINNNKDPRLQKLQRNYMYVNAESHQWQLMHSIKCTRNTIRTMLHIQYNFAAGRDLVSHHVNMCVGGLL